MQSLRITAEWTKGAEARRPAESGAGCWSGGYLTPDYLKTKTTHQRALSGRERASSRAFGRFLDTAFAKQEHASRGGKINTFAERTFFFIGRIIPATITACIATVVGNGGWGVHRHGWGGAWAIEAGSPLE
jgi:hypothetical protein